MRFALALVAMLTAGGAIGFGMPSPDEQGSTAAALATANPQAEAADGEPEEPANWAERAVIRRERDGHFYADVEVDGISARMLVDTGASVIALTGADAEAMGIVWSEADVAPIAQGANGPVEGVEVRLEHVQTGGFEAENVRAIIVPEGLAVSLLGQSFLSKIGRVEMAGDRLVMSRDGAE